MRSSRVTHLDVNGQSEILLDDLDERFFADMPRLILSSTTRDKGINCGGGHTRSGG